MTSLAPRRAHAQAPSSPGFPPNVQAGYDVDRGAFLGTADGRWELNPYAMVQLQNVSRWRGGKATDAGFVLRSAKLILHGHIYDPSLTYHFQINAGNGQVVAEDIYLQWAVRPQLTLVAGQIEVPFNRQHITLEAYQQLIDRSVTNQRFTLQRDIGVAAYLSDAGHHGELTVGVWNGSRQDVPNDNASYLWSARASWNPFGPIAFREADLDDSRSPRLSLAAAAAYNPERIVPATSATAASVSQQTIRQAVGESTLRYRGLSVSIEGHVRRMTVKEHAQRDLGGLVQVGYFLVPKHVEIVVRQARVVGDLGSQDTSTEQTVGVNDYFRGHRLKLQADASRLVSHDGVTTRRVRLQIEFFL